MCGIAGLVRPGSDPLSEQDQADLRAVARLQLHRGPDSQGLAFVDGCGLASQRLSIVDLSPTGEQPMTTDDGRYTLVYNGEIYNHAALRADLVAEGCTFRGTSDTEVLLRGLERHGLDFLRRCVGMWGFAAYDRLARRLLLSRDRFGVKPLYYVRLENGALAFASEIKTLVALMRRTGQAVTPSPGSIATFFATGLVDGLAETFFAGVQRFPAGQHAVFDAATGELTFQPYWSLPEAAASRVAELAGLDDAATLRLLHGTLVEAIHSHLRSDVPVGACLSGGLDSSAIVALAARETRTMQTFTTYYDSPAFDERSYARQVVGRTGAQPHEQAGNADELLRVLPDVTWHLDEPALGPSVYSMWVVMRLASEQVKVVVDGQGGDEVFGGYVPYHTQYLYQLAAGRKLPTFARETASLWRRLGQQTARRAARDALAMSLRPPVQTSPPDAAILCPELWDAVDDSFREWRTWPKVVDDWLNNVLLWELQRTRLPALLRYEDRLSMAFSIESRVPLLDHRLVELSFALPARWKIRDGWSKWALRAATADVLPPSISWRTDKMGFPIPFSQWLRGDFGERVEDMLLRSGGRNLRYLESGMLRRLFAEHRQGADRSALLWRALSLETWLAAFDL